MLSARGEEVDRIVGLELGADDYVTKPFNSRELLARVKNLIRRTTRMVAPDLPEYRFAGWTFERRTRRLLNRKGAKVTLTRAEFELLSILLEHPGVVMTRERLLNAVTHRSWSPSDRTIDVLIRRLRQKIEQNPTTPELILTAHGEGYVFTGDLD